MRVALDTNILAYAEGVNGAGRKKSALDVIEKLPPESTFLPVQALGELFHVLVRKAERTPKKARSAISSWQDTFPQIETSSSVLISAIDLAAGHALGIWDAIILAAASAAGCRLLISEDLQDGFTWNGVTVANPFAANRNNLLYGLLGE